MKNATRKFALVLVALVMILSLALTACTTKHDYTVKVVGPDDKPYTTAKVQPCLVDETAESGLGECYPGVATDKDGVAYLDIGKEIKDKNADEIEIHLLDLPSNLTYTPVRMKKGETKTVKVTEGSSVELKTPLRGTGVGSYENDWLTGEPTSAINLETFDPYVVITGSYALTFTSATQKIYYAFKAVYTGNYKVYSSGTIDPSITMMTGNKSGGIFCWHEDEFQSDNVSATDKNFSYDFIVDEMTIGMEEYVYFEVALEDANGVDVDAVITFEYVSDLQGGGSDEATSVDTKKTLEHYKEPMMGYQPMPIDGSAVYVKGSDGFYHKDAADGEIIFADLGTDSTLNDRHMDGELGNYPLGLDKSFTQIVAQGANLIFNIEGGMYDYYPLAVSYTSYSNYSGRYPLTDELIVLLNGYLTQKYRIDLFEEQNNITLPENDPWLVWCGYYEYTYSLEVEESADGSIDNPYTLKETNNVIIPAGGSVYYSYFTPAMPGTLTVTIHTSNISLVVYANGEQPGSPLVGTQDPLFGNYLYEVEINAEVMYYFVFSTVDGEAASDWIDVMFPAGPKEGSSENPYELSGYGSVTNEAELDNEEYESVFYTYVVTDEDAKLYIYLINNAVLRNLYYVDSNDVPHYLNVADATTGLEIPAGMTLWIEISAVSGDGEFTFGLYNKVMGVEDSPFWFETGTITIDVAAGGSVYYNTMPWWTLTYILRSDSTNVKILMYTGDLTTNATVLTSEETDLFYCTITLQEYTKYYFVFTTENGNADKYSVLITEEIPDIEDEEGSFDNPIILYSLGTYEKDLPSAYEDVCYSYTMPSDFSKLYFKWDANTAITIIYNGAYISTRDPDDLAKFAAGLEIEAGATIIIMVSVNDPETSETNLVSFTFSSEQIPND